MVHVLVRHPPRGPRPMTVEPLSGSPSPRRERHPVSTAQDLPVPYGEPLASAPALRLVPQVPLDFDEAVRRIRPRLHRYAVRRLGDLHEAEELVQEALLRAYSHRAQLLTED